MSQPSTFPETEKAIDTVARHAVHLALAEPNHPDEIALWEDYPDIGEHDWRRIIDRAKALAPPNPSAEEYAATYAHLSARVDVEYEAEVTR